MPFKPDTNTALGELVPWRSLLAQHVERQGLELHVYTDGSGSENRNAGHSGASAFYGTLGAQVQGNATTPWAFEAPQPSRMSKLPSHRRYYKHVPLTISARFPSMDGRRKAAGPQ